MDSLKKAFASLCDLDSPLVFFPVRHHSPACALHLGRMLEAYAPDAVLIEGPADTGDLIPHIGDPANRAPLCIYYSSICRDRDEDGKQRERRFACYYPMLDYSPELVAIRYGVKAGIDTRFIDLPYSALSLLERRREEGKDSYYDDYYLAHSRFIGRLCEKQGCRHYGELWEKLFEIGGLYRDTAAFVRDMLALCHYARVEYPHQLLEAEGCLARERYMAREIAAARRDHKRVLVVTGGFHTAALAALLEAPELPTPEDLPKGEASAYLIPYSFAESDQLSGYRSGMPHPAFYQRIHEGIGVSDAPYDDAVLEFLARVGGALRKKKHPTSIADEIAAAGQAKGLANLRGKPQQGVYELLDGVRSTYVKGEFGAAAAAVMDTAADCLRGDKMGEIQSGVDQVPLLLDFRETAKRLRLKVSRTGRQQVTLDILTKPAHRELSAFFHRLEYLNAGFGERVFGPNYRSLDTARVREKWTYGYGARVEAAIIDASYLGGTLREAASTALGRALAPTDGCGKLTKTLIDAAVMDLTHQLAPLLEAARESLAGDGSFQSLAQAVRNLLFLESAKWLLSLPDAGFAGDLLEDVYHKAVTVLPTLATAVEEEDRALAEGLKDLGEIARRPGMDSAVFREALLDLCGRRDPPPCLHGAAAGMLYAMDAFTPADVLACGEGYFFGTGGEMKRSGLFLDGLFTTAWDILFAGDGFLDGLTHVLSALDQEDFLVLLPDLRLAFSAFTPTQIDRIAERVAQRLGLAKASSLLRPASPEALLRLGRTLDQYASQRLQEVWTREE